MYLNDLKIKFIFIILIIFLYNCFYISFIRTSKKVGVIGLVHSKNVGNNLLKYAIYIKLTELGYSPYIVENRVKNHNNSFIARSVNMKLIQNFSEIKENDFDILMVNSDQTWRKYDSYFYDIAFLRFAEKWKKPKFIYGTSTGSDNWELSKEDDKIAKHLINDFTGISVREDNLVKMITSHLGFKSEIVLDPTLLIDKKYYLDLIKEYKSNIIDKSNNGNFIFAYILTKKQMYLFENYFHEVERKLNTKIFNITIYTENQVEEFLYGIINSKAVITNSFHGTIFSAIFNKPFVTFTYNGIKQSRFKTLNDVIKIENRIFDYNSFPSISLLTQPLKLKRNKLKLFRFFESIIFLILLYYKGNNSRKHIDKEYKKKIRKEFGIKVCFCLLLFE